MEAILHHECREEDDFYKILNCSEHSSTEQINTEYKILALECHPDKNPDDHTAAETFARLQKAKEVLSDEAMRKRYDQWKNSGIAMSYDQWCGLRDSVQTPHRMLPKPPGKGMQPPLLCPSSETMKFDKQGPRLDC